MLTVPLDSTKKQPLYEQLYRFIRLEIEQGNLAAGERMPSKRELSAHLKISQNTVDTAYSQLAAEGYLKAKPRSGFYVEQLEPLLPRAEKAVPYRANPVKEEHFAYDFHTGGVSTEHFPFSTWSKLMREVLGGSSRELLLATDPQGLPALREQIARYLHEFRGVAASPDQIVLGAGSEYLLGLLIQMLGRDCVFAVENPGYPRIRRILEGHSMAVRPVLLDARGMSAHRLRRTDARVAHITPSHQFPMGVVMPASRRSELLGWANERQGRYLIEDDYDSEFRFSGRPIPALQGMDGEKVIYLNTFAKSLAPSMRIGYMVLPKALLEEYRARFRFYSCTVPSLEQYTLERFLRGGYFERHLNRMRTLYKQKRDRLLQAMEESGLTGFMQISGEDAGMHFLLNVQNGMDEAELISRAREEKVRVYGLSEYVIGAPPAGVSLIVLGYGGLKEADMPEAAARLRRAWDPDCIA